MIVAEPPATTAGKYHLAYQPRIDLRSMKPVCAEALVRWRHPARGDVLPDEFIPDAELNGSIVALGEWVLNEAAHQLAEWRKGGQHLRMSVNVSMLQIEAPGFAQRFESLLATYHLRAQAFELEVTESQPLRHPRLVRTTLRRLHELGVGVAIDDFGRGFTGFHTLRWIPADVIKFDRSLVEPIDTDVRSARTLSALMQFAHALGAKAVAEGVERPAQLTLLHRMGCDQVQGYLLGHPGPASESLTA
jgi:EAL domain-containing protein (putative c-di-GMP-specific phosphodiesterase class I)